VYRILLRSPQLETLKLNIDLIAHRLQFLNINWRPCVFLAVRSLHSNDLYSGWLSIGLPELLPPASWQAASPNIISTIRSHIVGIRHQRMTVSSVGYRHSDKNAAASSSLVDSELLAERSVASAAELCPGSSQSSNITRNHPRHTLKWMVFKSQ